MKLAAERAAGELEAGMEAKRAEVKKMQIRAEQAEAEGSEMRTLVEELTHAGQVCFRLAVLALLVANRGHLGNNFAL